MSIDNTDAAEVELQDGTLDIMDEEIESLGLDDYSQDNDEGSDVDWRAEALKNKAIAKRLAKKLSTNSVKEPAQAPREELKAPVKTEGLSLDKIDEILESRLMQRDLDSLEVSDALRKEIRAYAQLNKLSVRQAAQSDYISFLKEKEVQAKRVEDAAISSTRKSQPRTDYAEATPSDFDLTSKEGREQWAQYKAWLKQNG